MTWYRSDRAFDAFDAGQVVELHPDTDEQHSRWVRTGYLEKTDDPGGSTPDGPPSVADQPTSTTSAAPADGAPAGEEADSGALQDAAGAGSGKRPRRRG